MIVNPDMPHAAPDRADAGRFAARRFHRPKTEITRGRRLRISLVLPRPMAIAPVVCAVILAGGAYVAVTSVAAEPIGDMKDDVKRPNLLLVTVDTLRADHLSCYGYARATSPHIDGLAQRGVRFENAYVQRGLTWPSLASIMCSVHPVTHGVRANGQKLKRNHVQLAQILTENGYTCGAILTNAATQDWQGFAHVAPPLPVGADHDATRLALEWLGKNRSGPFFLWIHYSAPHAAYDPPAPYRNFLDPAYDGPMDGKGSTLADATVGRVPLTPADLDHVFNLYDGEIRYTDDEVGAVLNYLDETGLRQSTMVVFTADHGEELFQHHRYFGHGASMYQGVLQVPLIISCGWTETKGIVVDAIVQSVDIAPTILELFKIAAPEPFQGRSLAGAIHGKTLDDRPAFAEYSDAILAVKTREYKLIWNPGEFRPVMRYDAKALGLRPRDFRKPKRQGNPHRPRPAQELFDALRVPIRAVELYDAKADRYEARDLSADRPEAVEELKKLIDGFRREFGWEFGTGDPDRFDEDLDPATREEMKALGYVL